MILDAVLLATATMAFGLITGVMFGRAQQRLDLERRLADAESKFNALVGMVDGVVAPHPGQKFLMYPGDTLRLQVGNSCVTLATTQSTTLVVDV